MRLVKFFLGFLVICMFTLFATANMQKVPLNFLFTNQSLIGYSRTLLPDGTIRSEPNQIYVFVLVYVAFGVGFITSWCMSMGINRTQRRKIKKLNKTIEAQETELNTLRNLPVTDQEVRLEDQSVPLPLPGNEDRV